VAGRRRAAPHCARSNTTHPRQAVGHSLLTGPLAGGGRNLPGGRAIEQDDGGGAYDREWLWGEVSSSSRSDRSEERCASWIKSVFLFLFAAILFCRSVAPEKAACNKLPAPAICCRLLFQGQTCSGANIRGGDTAPVPARPKGGSSTAAGNTVRRLTFCGEPLLF
jgi:hypothetical protein